MKRILILLLLTAVIAGQAKAQGKYWVFFTDKEGVEFNPYEYFDEKAIERRIKHNLELYDITDYPVKDDYLQGVDRLADSSSHHSRWFNAVAVYAQPGQLAAIKALPYVKKVSAFPTVSMQLAEVSDKDYDTTLGFQESLMLENQTMELGRNVFKRHNMDGSGVRVAVFDAGFPWVDELPVFEHIRKDNRILKTWDFTSNKEDVYKANKHGTMVLSAIAGITGNTPMGLATGAEFILARTEVFTEPFSEEENWLAAAEWADKNGADIINSSLGYTFHRYFPEEMDGEHSLVADAANMAASKGILVVNAAGNSGSEARWHVIGTPADADSVLSVGGVEPNTGYHISFSSYGPTADMRLKPNVSAFGQVIAAEKDGLANAFGTSFASPLVAGFAACALQANPELKAMELFREIEKAGHLYPYFDYAHGYGLPQAAYLFDEEKSAGETFQFVEENGNVTINLDKEVFENQDYMTRFVLYYNIQKPSGVLDRFYVISVNQTDVLELDKSEIPDGYKLNVHYVGYTATYEF